MAKKYIDAELIKSTRALYFDIDACITELIRARTEQNEENEGKALFRMEGLMVATMQQLDCIIDTLQQEQPSEDLEEEIKRYIPRDQCPVPDLMEAVAHHFANWQKEQMLKEAVEGYVNYYEDSGGILMAEAQVGCPYHIGDKVRIIIVKEGEK